LSNRRWLRTGEVAKLFNVNPKTIKRWVQSNKLKATRTAGGHARFEFEYIMELIKNNGALLLLFILFI
jgi:excisionase family DNA binding protein